MSFYKRFFLLSDPFSGEPKIVDHTDAHVQMVIRNYTSAALNNKEKTETDEWILELMNKNRVPLIESLGQFKFISVYETEKKLQELKDQYFPPEELEEEVDEVIEEITTEVTEILVEEIEQQVELEEVKEIPIPKKTPKKRKTTKKRTPRKKK